MLEFIETIEKHKLKKRIAIIDIGSNAVRLHWADTSSSGHYEIIEKIRIPLCLGKSVFKTGEINSKCEKELITALTEFKKALQQVSVSKFLCVATSAMRDAKNSADILKKVKAKTDINIKIITGTEEAQLIQDSVRQVLPNLSAPCIFLDIGGGSTEICFQSKSDPIDLNSFQLGTVRMLEKMPDDLDKLKNYLKLLAEKETTKMTIVGTGGNLRRLGKLKKKILNNSNVSYLKGSEFNKIFKEISDVDPLKLMKKYDLKHDRAEVIGPALKILKTILEIIPNEGIHLPQVGLAHALLYELTIT